MGRAKLAVSSRRPGPPSRSSGGNEEFDVRFQNLNVGSESFSSRQSLSEYSNNCQSKTKPDGGSPFSDNSNWEPRSYSSQSKHVCTNYNRPNLESSKSDFSPTQSENFNQPSPVVFTTAPTVPSVVRPIASKPFFHHHSESSPFVSATLHSNSSPSETQRVNYKVSPPNNKDNHQKMNLMPTLGQEPLMSILRRAETPEILSDSSRQDPKSLNVRQQSARTPGDAVGHVSGVGRAALIRRLKEKQLKS